MGNAVLYPVLLAATLILAGSASTPMPEPASGRLQFRLAAPDDLQSRFDNSLSDAERNLSMRNVHPKSLWPVSDEEAGGDGRSRVDGATLYDRLLLEDGENSAHDSGGTYFLVSQAVEIAGTAIKTARAVEKEWGWAVEVEFSDDGTAALKKVTSENIGKRMAVLFDGRLITAPVIQTRIAGGKVQIAGRFDSAEAWRIARALNAEASSPAPVHLIPLKWIAGISMPAKLIAAMILGF